MTTEIPYTPSQYIQSLGRCMRHSRLSNPYLAWASWMRTAPKYVTPSIEEFQIRSLVKRKLRSIDRLLKDYKEGKEISLDL